jgi:peptidoglycan/xylan/chitin deacetylase (PgdA/CDA1 family)
MELTEFARHMDMIRQRLHEGVCTLKHMTSETLPVLLTFDDGGIGAYEHTAGVLEQFGWKGHFFITTDYIGTTGFLNPVQIRSLRDRGHIIGSHSCSHPPRMSMCNYSKLLNEWRNSCNMLEDILGEKTFTASVPGGYYNRNVAEAAAEAGVETLFTSEPITQAISINGCLILGRYTIKQGMSADIACKIASGLKWPRFQQLAYWEFKKLIKKVGGNYWLQLRKAILDRRQCN